MRPPWRSLRRSAQICQGAKPLSLGLPPAVGLSADGLPLGLQIIGKPLDEAGVLDAGLAIERAAGFVARPDRWW